MFGIAPILELVDSVGVGLDALEGRDDFQRIEVFAGRNGDDLGVVVVLWSDDDVVGVGYLPRYWPGGCSTGGCLVAADIYYLDG